MSVEFEPFSHRWRENPYPKYRELRDSDPVHHSPATHTWTVSRHEDVRYVLKNADIFSSRIDRPQGRRALSSLDLLTRARLLVTMMTRMRANPWTMNRSRMLIAEGGEVHAVMRNIVNRGFTPGRIAAWEGRIRELVEAAMARMSELEQFDLVHELAVPLPVTVIAEMLGIDSTDMRKFKKWSDTIIQSTGSSGLGDEGQPSPFRGEALDAMADLRRYLRPIVRARRRKPEDDLISVLLEAEGDAALTNFEVFMFVFLLLLAGNETTTNLLGNAVDALLEHPDQLKLVAEDLSLVPGLVEETLRWDSPVQMLTRVAKQEVEIAGVKIPKGAQVSVLLGSANRDERQFPDPDRFDVTRDTRGHLAFGFGEHFCLGAALARLESKGALEALVPALPRLARVRSEQEFLDSFVVRGRTRLELRAAA